MNSNLNSVEVLTHIVATLQAGFHYIRRFSTKRYVVRDLSTYRPWVEIRHGETNLAVWLESSGRCQHLPADKRLHSHKEAAGKGDRP